MKFLKFTTTLLFFIFSLPQSIAQVAMDFDGIDDFISVPNASTHIANGNLSLSLWVYPTNPAPAYPDFDGIAGFRNDNNADFYLLQLSATSVEARFRNSAGNNFDIVYNGITLNAWNHLVFTYDGSTITLYHNGTSVGTQSANGNITSTTETLNIGYVPFSSPNFYLDGQLEDVSLWSKSLSSIEAAALYTDCSIDLSNPDLELCYQFNGGSPDSNNAGITIAADSKGNIDGVLNNFALNGTVSNFVTGLNSTTSTANISICSGSYTSPSGNILTVSGTYLDTLQTSSGCDSIITTHLLIGSDTDTTNIDAVTCNSYTSPSGLYTWTSSGVYSDTLSDIAGCDSVLTINLTVNQSTSSTLTAFDCDNYTMPNGNIVTTSGTYTNVLTNSNGCDSTITINLTIGNSNFSILVSGCDSYTSPSGNYVWTNSGTYSDTITNHLGCDSVITINLALEPTIVDTSVTQLSDTLMASNGLSYQWLDCDNGYSPIVGATNQTFIGTSGNSYAVEVSNGVCSDTSSCYTIMNTSTFPAYKNAIQIFPNPVNNQFSVDLGETYQAITVRLLDLTGKEISSNHFSNQTIIKMETTLQSGLYLVSIEADNRQFIQKIVITK